MVFDAEIVEDEPTQQQVSRTDLATGQQVAEVILNRIGLETCLRLDINPESIMLIDNGVVFRNVIVNRNGGRGNIRVVSVDKYNYHLTITLNARNFSPEETIADWKFLDITNAYFVIDALWR